MRLNPEQIEHINVVNWFSFNYPDLADDLHHFANERKCSPQQGRLLKRMGVKKGVSDFFLALSCGGFYGLWIELKTFKGRLSEEQLDFLERKRQRGYCARVAYGADEAKEAILSYLDNHVTNGFYSLPKNCS
jgi:hypothetical protein